MSKLDYNPMDSKALNETFKLQEVRNIDEKYESLIAWWINRKFAEQLDIMFGEIKASADEIMRQKPNILIANNEIEKYDLRGNTKTSLKIMKAVNDPEYLDSEMV